MPIPTKRFWLLIALGIPLALLGIVLPGIERLVIAYDLLLVALFFGTRAMLGKTSMLSASRAMDAVLSVRTGNSIELTLHNEGKIHLKGRLRDEIPDTFEVHGNEGRFSLRPGDTHTHVYDVRPLRRGTEVMPGTYVRLAAPLGLCELQFRIPNEQEVQIYPNVKAVYEFDLLNRRGRLSMMGIRRTRYRGLGTEFESLRQYTPDDEFRRIDWKASSKRNDIVVRDYQVEKNQAVILVIDAGRHMMADVEQASKLDHVLDSALLLMHAAERAGDQIGLLVFAEEVLKYVPPRRGRAQINIILEAIHDLQARPVEPNLLGALAYLGSRWKRRALVVMFTDLESKAQSERFLHAIQGQRFRHLWFITRVKDPMLDELAVRPLESKRDFYQRAALSWYQDQRNAALGALRDARLETIESEPANLAHALVGAYVDAKQRGAL